MKNNDFTHELINRYFEGDLNAAELIDFRKRLEEDASFAAAFELEKDLIQGIEALGNSELKATLQTIHQEEIIQKRNESKKAKVITMRPYRWMSIAAAIAVVAVVAIWLLKTPDHSTDLFAAHYQTPAFETLRGDQDENLKEIQAWYTEKDFQKAITAMNSYLKTNPTDEPIRLSLGIAQLEVGQIQDAIQTFQQLTQSTQLDDQATWFLAMAYLKNNQNNLAKIELQKLVDGTILVAPKRKLEAAKLLEQL